MQRGGRWYQPELLPGFTDRRGVWRSSLASYVIGEALANIGYDYLLRHPPVDCAFPYRIAAVLSYCDTRLHSGTIYRAAGFQLARKNDRGIETWYTLDVAPLSNYEDDQVRKLSRQDERSRRLRAKREAQGAQQGVLFISGAERG